MTHTNEPHRLVDRVREMNQDPDEDEHGRPTRSEAQQSRVEDAAVDADRPAGDVSDDAG